MQYCDEERIKRRFEFVSNTNPSARMYTSIRQAVS